MTDTEEIEVPLDDGADLAVRLDVAEGARTWLVFAHGFGSTQYGDKISSFRSWAAEAGLGFASFDFRGHGASGGSLREITLTRNVEDLRAALDALALRHPRSRERTVLVGSSMGAASAMWFCARNPRRVQAAVHIAPALYLQQSLERTLGDEGVRKWCKEGSFLLEGELAETELDWELMADLRRHPVDELAARYRTPTLLLVGRQDETVPQDRLLEFVGSCDAEIDVVTYGAGDHRLLQQKDRLWTALLDFLAARRLL